MKEDEYMFSFEYLPRYGDYKNYDSIKPGSILDMVQDVSTKASEDCGYGIDALRKMGIAWLLQGIKVRFEKNIRPDEAITIQTAVKPSGGVTSERCCYIIQKGEIVGKTIANWFLFDSAKKRPVRIPSEMLAVYPVGSFEDDFFTYKKLSVSKDEEVRYSIRVSNKDIDTNMHLNNQKGAEILVDALPFDFYFNQIQIIYKNPSFLGEELDVCVKETENGYYVHLQTKDKDVRVAGTFEFVK